MFVLKKRFLVRLCIVGVWIGLIFSWLYAHYSSDSSSAHDKKVLHVFSWSDVLPVDVLEDFKKETGITVYIHYYSSNEELLLKLKNNKRAGYDLIIPSDYAVKTLNQEGLLKPLNKSKLLFLQEIHPLLVGHDYDRDNLYSLPLQWDVYGFGVDADVFKDPSKIPYTWDHLFKDDLIHYKIAMTNDPIEAFCVGALYLFGTNDKLSRKDTQRVKDLLIEQKKHVEAYAVPRSDYVLGSKNAPVALTLSAYILRSQEYFRFIRFVIPKQKTFISIENIAIPITARHEHNTYEFLNFLYRPENLARACNSFGVFPATVNCGPLLRNNKEFIEIQKQITQEGYQLLFFKHLFPERELRLLWTEIKS
jgi:spermidine/putrescine transport system substrate-binding protein